MMRVLVLLALAGCGRTVTAPETTFENIAKYCVASDSGVINGYRWTRYECRVQFKP